MGNANGTMIVVNCLLAGNQAPGGSGGLGAGGGDGLGGGLFNGANGQTMLIGCLIVGNEAIGGAPGPAAMMVRALAAVSTSRRIRTIVSTSSCNFPAPWLDL
jgi:hypothetical protein